MASKFHTAELHITCSMSYACKWPTNLNSHSHNETLSAQEILTSEEP